MNREVGFCFSKTWKPLICSPSRILLNMTPNLQGYVGQFTLSSPRLLGQCSLGIPAFPPTTFLL
jgi:hypothetical protein